MSRPFAQLLTVFSYAPTATEVKWVVKNFYLSFFAE